MKNFYIKKILAVSLVSLFFMQMIYVNFEPSVALAAVATDNVVVTLTVDAGITITTPADVVMAPNLGIAANGAIGSSAWTVKTNNAIGYTLAVKASASPALVSGGGASFVDYTEASAGVPEVWNVPTSNKEFGYSAFGTDVVTATWGTTATCGTGSVPNASMKYVGFKITDKTIASSSTVTPSAGTTTTVCFAAEQDTVFAPSGVYTATITATATTL